MSSTPDTYVHGHGAAVLRSHTSRTVANSAAYLEPWLQPGAALLDVGCGPGTISIEFAQRVAPGQVTAIDPVADVLAGAEERRVAAGVDNCSFATGDVYALAYDDDTFDVAHAHQVLQHLTDPVAALREMRRVVKPGGVVGVRDADYASMVWTPASPMLDRWLEIYHAITDAAGCEADAGRYLFSWANEVGFADVACSSSTWTFATPDQRRWWGDLWADRVVESSYRTQALEHGFSTVDELEAIAAAWRAWAAEPDGWFCVMSAEIVCTV